MSDGSDKSHWSSLVQATGFQSDQFWLGGSVGHVGLVGRWVKWEEGSSGPHKHGRKIWWVKRVSRFSVGQEFQVGKMGVSSGKRGKERSGRSCGSGW
jgi:hypothetical protein